MLKNPLQCLTGEVRLSYVNLIEPKASEQGAEKKYSAQLLIPKSDTNTLENIKSAIMAAVDDAVSKKWGGIRPQIDFFSIVHDGDGVKPQAGTPYGAECKGHWVLNSTSRITAKPWVCDINDARTELLPQDIYSGMYAKCLIGFYGYKNRKVGIGCSLNAVYKTKDGDALGGVDNAALAAAVAQAGLLGVPTEPNLTPGTNVGAAPVSYGAGVGPMGAGATQGQINPITGLPM